MESSNGLLGSLIGTVKTDNKIDLSFDVASLLKAGAVGVLATVIGGLLLKYIAKRLNL